MQSETIQQLPSRREPRILSLKNVLVPTDFSDESLKAVRHGVAFASQFDAALTLLYVVPPVPAFVGFEAVPLVVDDGTELQGKSREHLAQLARKEIPTSVASHSLVRSGAPFEEVVSAAKDLDIDLVVISTHGHTGIKRVAFGSTAERIVQRAGCPVLVVREKEHEFVRGAGAQAGESPIRINRILVAIDFSERSRKALQYAVGFAKEFGASIICVHILNPPSYGAGEAGIALEFEAIQKSFRLDAEKKMAALLDEFAGSIEAETIIVTGPPYREIINLADKREVDLIVVGTHGRTGIGHFLLGSTAERIVRHAHTPVLVVREKEHDFLKVEGADWSPIP